MDDSQGVYVTKEYAQKGYKCVEQPKPNEVFGGVFVEDEPEPPVTQRNKATMSYEQVMDEVGNQVSVLEKQLCWNNSQHEIQQIAELAGITESLLLQYCAVTGRRIYLTLTDCRQDSKYYSWQANKLQSLGNSVEQVASALGITEKEAKQKMGVPYSMQGI